jgi:hypothetical protein
MASWSSEIQCRQGIVHAEPLTPVAAGTVRLLCDTTVAAGQKGALEANTVYSVLSEVGDAAYELAVTTAPADITLATAEFLPEGVPILIKTELQNTVSIKCSATLAAATKYVRFSKRVGTQGS